MLQEPANKANLEKPEDLAHAAGEQFELSKVQPLRKHKQQAHISLLADFPTGSVEKIIITSPL